MLCRLSRADLEPPSEAFPLCSESMIHKKVVRSALHFHPVTDLHPSLDPGSLVLGAVQKCLQAEAVELACLWDAAALLMKTQEEEVAVEAAEDEDMEGAGKAHVEQQTNEAEQRLRHSAVCRSSVFQVALLALIFQDVLP